MGLITIFCSIFSPGCPQEPHNTWVQTQSSHV